MATVVFDSGTVTVNDLHVTRLYEVIHEDDMHHLDAEMPDVTVWKGVNMTTPSLSVEALYLLPNSRLKISGSSNIKYVEYLGLPETSTSRPVDKLYNLYGQVWWCCYNIIKAAKPKNIRV